MIESWRVRGGSGGALVALLCSTGCSVFQGGGPGARGGVLASAQAPRAAAPAKAVALVMGLSVPGTANIWLAGAPNGTKVGHGDRAPEQAPVTVKIPEETGCRILTFEVEGGTSNDAGCAGGCGPPDGRQGVGHTEGVQRGIADARIPMNALMGLFLPGVGEPDLPDLKDVPSPLDFSKQGLDFERLAPLLAQPFFIGDGKTAAASTQRFVVPEGATRLMLGSMDAYGWNNNSGSFEVSVRILACVSQHE